MKMKNYKIILNFALIIFLVVFNGCIDLYQPKNSNTIYVDINEKYDYNTIQDAVNNSLENILAMTAINIGALYNRVTAVEIEVF